MSEPAYRPAPAWVSLGSRAVRLLPRGRYVLMNWLCRRAPAPFESPLGVTRGRASFVCDLRDGIAREACFMGYYEPQETVLVRGLLRPGETFVDVGANWGYFTLLAAGFVGPTGRVVSFEPHPALHALLAANVARNRFAWATPVRAAVADAEGELNLAGFADGACNWGLSRLTAGADPHAPNFRVRAGLLEKMLDREGVGRVDLLKMDIEGGEGPVLPTMRGGLARGRYRRILLELHPAALAEQGRDARALVELVLGFGYRAWRVDHSPAAFRRAAYRLPEGPAGFLEAFDPGRPLDRWPHLLLLAPGVEPSWREADGG